MCENSRGEKSVITTKKIQQILENYKIGKKPLAKLLGWGETTIIRYIEGDIPTNEYSERLKYLLENPNYYYELLTKNKDSLTDIAYRKSRKAVLSRLMETKIDVAAQYIINQCDGQISGEELDYLLYYGQCFSLAFYDVPIFFDDYVVSDDPVPYPGIYKFLKNRKMVSLEIHPEVLTQEDKEVINGVLKGFRWYGIKTLQTMVSFEKSMLRISRDKDNCRIISKPVLTAYFLDLCKYYDMKEPSHIGRYPDHRIVDIKNLPL